MTTGIGKEIARAHFYELLRSARDKRNMYRLFKSTLDYSNLCEAADFLAERLPEKLLRPMHGMALPSSYAELGDNAYWSEAATVQSEINWLLLSLRRYSREIALFLQLQREYERHLLLGDYEKAAVALARIEEHVCFSLYTLENRFILCEYGESAVANKRFLSEFNALSKTHSQVRFFAHFFSMRAEKGVSISRYVNDINLNVASAPSDVYQLWHDYSHLKLNFLNSRNANFPKELLSLDFQFTVIDRYLTFRQLCVALLSKQELESDGQELIDLRKYVRDRLPYVIDKVGDPVLARLCGYNNPKYRDFGGAVSVLPALDKYTVGLYKDAESILKDQLEIEPGRFDLYDLYTKALIHQGEQYKPVGNPRSFQNMVLSAVYRLNSIDITSEAHSNDLHRIANTLSSVTLSYGILDFVERHGNQDLATRRFGLLSYSPDNPALYEQRLDNEGREQLLFEFRKRFPDSLTIRLLLAQFDPDVVDSELSSGVPDIRLRIARARAFQYKGKFEQAVAIWIIIAEDRKQNGAVRESAIRQLFECYAHLKRFDDCMRLYVESYCENNHIVDRISVNTVLDAIKLSRFKCVTPTLYLPVFYSLTGADENELHNAYERFMFSNGVSRPTELLLKVADHDPRLITLFLSRACTLENLKHSIFVSGSLDRLEQRLAVLQYLRERDPAEKKAYDAEIDDISRTLVIERGLRALDESKIYVNEQGIVQQELKELEAVFQRFKAIAGVTEKGGVFFVHKGRLLKLEYSSNDEPSAKEEFSASPTDDLFLEMFDEIKQKFLYSKFGLVAYLSTRIRHGVLLGELRPVFEKHRLVTLMAREGLEYRDNAIWGSLYRNQPSSVLGPLQEALRSFSRNVDNLLDRMVKEHLQIRSKEGHPEGWFDYDFASEELIVASLIGLKASTLQELVEVVFGMLWARTDSNLTRIRKKISVDFADQLNTEFNELEIEVDRLLGVNYAGPLTAAIKACSTDVQGAIHRVASWFTRSGSVVTDMDLAHLVDIVIEQTNKTYSTRRIEVERDVENPCLIRGEYLTHMSDLLRIFLENILKHTVSNQPRISARLSANVTDNVLTVRIENDVSTAAGASGVGGAASEEVEVGRVFTEGKSGHYKARKILASDLRDERNALTVGLSEDGLRYVVSIRVNLIGIRA